MSETSLSEIVLGAIAAAATHANVIAVGLAILSRKQSVGPRNLFGLNC